jgi:hypothetical protein
MIIVRLEEVGQLKKFSDLIGTRSPYLPACSIVPEPTTLPRSASRTETFGNHVRFMHVLPYIYMIELSADHSIRVCRQQLLPAAAAPTCARTRSKNE